MPNYLELDSLNQFVSVLNNRLCYFNSGFVKFMQNEFCLVTEPSVTIAKRKTTEWQRNPNTGNWEHVEHDYGDALYRFSFRIKSEVAAHSREMHIFFDTEEDIRNYVTTSFDLLQKETGAFVADREIQGVYAFKRTNRMVQVSDWRRNGHRETVYLSATIDPASINCLLGRLAALKTGIMRAISEGPPISTTGAQKRCCVSLNILILTISRILMVLYLELTPV